MPNSFWTYRQQERWPYHSSPEAMLDLFRGDSDQSLPRLSPRKLRLFLCACARLTFPGYGPDLRPAEVFAESPTIENRRAIRRGNSAFNLHDVFLQSIVNHDPFAGVVMFVRAARMSVYPERMADLLREQVGDPFLGPFWSPGCSSCGGVGWKTECDHDSDSRHRRPCRKCGPPAQVVSLALAAHEERLLPTGTLDPVRLGILADAVEDLGLPESRCPRCKGTGMEWNGGSPGDADLPPGHVRCRPTSHDPRPCRGVRPHPVLEHLRELGSRYRGCWSVDCLLGKEMYQ